MTWCPISIPWMDEPGFRYSCEANLSDEIISTPRWDKYERSVLLALADNVTVGIKGGMAHLTITKAF